METAIARVDVSPEVQSALTWPDRARSVTITDQQSYSLAASLLREIAGLKKATRAEFEEPKQKAHDAHKAVCAMEAKYLKPLDEADAILRRAVLAWDMEQKRLQRQRESEAREAERKRLEEARLLEAASVQQQAIERGASTEEATRYAEEVLEAPIMVVAPVLPTYEKAEGISTKTVPKARVIDMKALARAVADGKAGADCLLPNQKRLDKLAAALGEELNIPGVEVYEETGLAVRS